jgi:hypothetical protein
MYVLYSPRYGVPEHIARAVKKSSTILPLIVTVVLRWEIKLASPKE